MPEITIDSPKQEVLAAVAQKEALDFIKKNESFFRTPLPDFLQSGEGPLIPVESKGQKKFSKFFQENNKLECIKDYSSKLQKLLYRERENIRENTQKPLINYWNLGDFKTVLKNKKIRDFIMENKEHPALLLWENSKKIEPLNVYFQQIKEKSEELSNRGFLKAAKEASDLFGNLIAQKESLIQGKLSVQNFIENCNKLSEKAQDSELKNHRGLFGSIWHGIKVALNAITFGAVAITPTDSIKKTMELKSALKDFADSNASKAEDEIQPEENTDFRFK